VISELDNIFWSCLTGPQAQFASGTGNVRRYARGFSPIVGCRDPEDPDFAALAPLFDAGESFYIDRWQGIAPQGWAIVKEAGMMKMVWDAPAPAEDAAPAAIRLQPEHYGQALELAQLTNPGPFGIRTPELGEYFGHFDGDRLVAMAGERTRIADLHEISGVCTHPDIRGKGHARKLTLKLVHRQLARGKLPFLHVLSTNPAAHALYLKMGFRDYLKTVVRVVRKI
jgi:ribosomal protein S18 acetylase RimI-like enzyme